MFSERGYTTLEIDLGMPNTKASSSDALMHRFESGSLHSLSVVPESTDHELLHRQSLLPTFV